MDMPTPRYNLQLLVVKAQDSIQRGEHVCSNWGVG